MYHWTSDLALSEGLLGCACAPKAIAQSPLESPVMEWFTSLLAIDWKISISEHPTMRASVNMHLEQCVSICSPISSYSPPYLKYTKRMYGAMEA